MALSEADSKRVSAIRKRDGAVLQELYQSALPLVVGFMSAPETAKNYLQDALLRVREDIFHDRLNLAHKTLRDYLVHLCRERFDREEKDRELEQKVIDSLRSQENDGWAFYYMQMHYFPGVKFFVLKSGGTEEEAKDVIMDGIEALIRNIRDGQYVFQDNAKLKTYFFQICRNKWFDYVNRKQRQKPISLMADLNLEDFDNNYFYEFNEDLLNDRQRIVAELFGKSTDTCRQVLSYFYYDELSHDEIAERMGFSGPDSSKTQKNKCLRKLKTALKTILTGQEVIDLQTS